MTNEQTRHGPFYAHTGKTTDGADWQLLAEHLMAVSNGAAARGRSVDTFRSRMSHRIETEAKLAGCLHDLGKYRPEFQDRLFGRPVPRERTFHKQAGAAKAAMIDETLNSRACRSSLRSFSVLGLAILASCWRVYPAM